MLRVISDASPLGLNSLKRGLNVITAIFDGSVSAENVLHLDARTLYRFGNNLGVNFMLESADTLATCAISGSVKNMPQVYNRDDLENWNWQLITTLDNSTAFFHNSTLEMFGSLRFQFTGTSPVIISMNRS